MINECSSIIQKCSEMIYNNQIVNNANNLLILVEDFCLDNGFSILSWLPSVQQAQGFAAF